MKNYCIVLLLLVSSASYSQETQKENSSIKKEINSGQGFLNAGITTFTIGTVVLIAGINSNANVRGGTIAENLGRSIGRTFVIAIGAAVQATGIGLGVIGYVQKRQYKKLQISSDQAFLPTQNLIYPSLKFTIALSN